MTEYSVSIVIVSRRRPTALRRALLAVSQLQYSTFEVIVVADPKGLSVCTELSFGTALKLIPFDIPNISAARNLGLSHAAGQIVAFIDDDAVPEPQWLNYLTQPASRPEVSAMCGFVRGRNGISFQWQAARVDADGVQHPISVDPEQITLLTAAKGEAIKTEGTNMAFRRDVLAALGGFDAAFQYFLDETDLNMRLAREGHVTAVVPLAEVHHGFAGNSFRHVNRVPRDLFDIGASWAVFHRKHVARARHVELWEVLRDAQRKRLLNHLIAGGLEPRDVPRLMARLDQGHAEGKHRSFGTAPLAAEPVTPFARFPSQARASILIATRPIRARRDRQVALDRVKRGDVVTMLNLSPTALYHRTWFDDAGLWVQRGGLFGRSDRNTPLVQLTTRAARVEKERGRGANQRGFDQISA